MRIAVLTDAHANLPALEATLAAIRAEGCEAIYHTGDAIGIGPQPAECLDLLLGTPGLRCLMGNHDAWFAFGLPEPRPAWMSEGELAHHRWVHARLDPALRPVVAAWPWVLEEQFEGLPVSFLHYPLVPSGSDFADIMAEPTPEDFDRLFAPYSRRLIFYGHHHPASDLRGRVHYVNPGALGCSKEPAARFAILDVGRGGQYTVEHRAAPYDDQALFRAFEERLVPEREAIYRMFFGGRRPSV